MSNGFDRLRGVLIASAMGVNVVGAGSARATTTTIRQAIPTRGLNISYSLNDRDEGFYATNLSPDPTSQPIYTNWGWMVGPGKATETLYSSSISTDTNFLLGNTGSQNAFVARLGQLYFSVTNGSSSTITTRSYSYAVGGFDGVMGLKVDGQTFVNPSSQVDLTYYVGTNDAVSDDIIIQTDARTDLVTGLSVSINHRFFSDQPVLRSLFTFQNTSSADITVDATVVGDHFLQPGSAGLTFHGSRNASGDNSALEENDYWYIASDSDWVASSTEVGAPHVVLVRYGVDGEVVPTNVDSYSVTRLDDFSWEYELTIPAGETKHIMAFAAVVQYLNDAQESAAVLDDLGIDTAEEFGAAINNGALTDLQSAGLLIGLDSSLQANIANFSTVSTSSNDTSAGNTSTSDTIPRTTEHTTSDSTDDDSDGSALSPTALALLLLLLGRAAATVVPVRQVADKSKFH